MFGNKELKGKRTTINVKVLIVDNFAKTVCNMKFPVS